MTQPIDVKKIMEEIRAEVDEKMKNPIYAKDIHQLQRSGTSTIDTEKEFTDLYALTFLSKRITIPRSTKTGIVSKLMNSVIVKMYWIVSKMLAPVLSTQEKLNRSVVEELIEIKKYVGDTSADKFPLNEEFMEEFIKPKAISKTQSQYFEKFIDGKKTVGIFGTYVKNLVDTALALNVEHIVACDKTLKDHECVTSSKMIFRNTDYIELLKERHTGEFQTIVLMDVIEYYPVERVLTLCNEIKRTLAPNGKLFLRTLNIQNPNQLIEANNPLVQRQYHPDFVFFILKHLSLKNIQIENEVILNDQGNKYVVSAQK